MACNLHLLSLAWPMLLALCTLWFAIRQTGGGTWSARFKCVPLSVWSMYSVRRRLSCTYGVLLCLRKGHRMGLPWNVSCRFDLIALSAVASFLCCIIISTSYFVYDNIIHTTIIRRRPLCCYYYYLLLRCIIIYHLYHHHHGAKRLNKGQWFEMLASLIHPTLGLA